MAGLVDKLFEGGVWTPSAVRFENTVPAGDADDPIVSASPNNSGEAIADVYSLTFANIDTVANTATVFVNTQSPNNPFRNQVGIGIIIDGATVHKNVIPGVDLVFSGSGAFVNTWAATVKVGSYLGTFAAYGAGAGTPGAAIRHQVENQDSGAAALCKARLINMVIQVKKVGSIFSEVRPFAESAVEKVAGGGSERVMPYAITTLSVVAGVSASIRVDGAVVNVKNLDTSVETASNDLELGELYRITSGPLIGVEFKLDTSISNASTANILVFEPRYVEIAPDVAGVAGTWGVSDVDLTQAGQTVGTIQPGAVAYYHIRAKVPDGANAESNPYPANVALVGLQTGTAGWML